MEGQMTEVKRPVGRILPGKMTTEEVATFFDVTAQAVRGWSKRGLLPIALVVNGQHFYEEQVVATFEMPRTRWRRILQKARELESGGQVQ
jgi:DNA-binding transcriptional MerR regulator